MPVRHFVTQIMSERLRGTHMFRFGESETITRAQLDDAEAVADAIYSYVVDRVDWSRIAIEAHLRCMRADHGNAYRGGCGPCLRDALLATDRTIDHDDDGPLPAPTPPTWLDDWPADVVRVIGYRRTPVTRPKETP
jgi:hypothetical protein